LVAAQIAVDRKILADLVVRDEAAFNAILDQVVRALEAKRAA